jgi:hypothetical protein
MEFDIPRRKFAPGQVLCINRKMHDQPVKPRQAAFVDRFAQGCNGAMVSAQESNLYLDHPLCIRGMKFTGAVQKAWKENRTFYYIDNGYFGNQTSKIWFRIIKNNVHDVGPIRERSGDRLSQCAIQLKSFRPGSKILVAPPSEKSLSLWSMNPDHWVAEVSAEIRKYTDRPIEIRLKRPRTERLKENTMEQALADDVHCLVTYNSVAAVEAIMLGKPAFTLGPNAAGVLSLDDLSKIETPRIPTEDERQAWLRHLSYCQFNFTEMSNGYAWRILNS